MAKGNPRKRGRRQLEAMRRTEESIGRAAGNDELAADRIRNAGSDDRAGGAAVAAGTDGNVPVAAAQPDLIGEDVGPDPRSSGGTATAKGYVPPAPDRLSAEGRAVWENVAGELWRLKFLRATDIEPFARYCETVALYWETREKLKAEGAVIFTSSAHVENMPRTNPRFSQLVRLEYQLESLEDRFGLNPRARQQILIGLAARAIDLPLTDPNKTRANDGANEGAAGGATEAPAATPQGGRAIGFLNPAQRLN